MAVAALITCTLFATATGIVGAVVTLMGLLAFPAMLKARYNTSLAAGVICAGGTLGILIPPSIGFVIYGILTEQSIGRLFMAGIFPGILLAGLFMLAIYLQCLVKEGMGPRGGKKNLSERILSLYSTWPMIVLFLLVMGGIYYGICTPTEAAGIGAFGAFTIALFKGRLNFDNCMESLLATGNMTAMIFLIIIGANIFSSFLALTGIPMIMADAVADLALPKIVILLIMILIFVLLGCVMDCFAIMILMVPILYPIIQLLAFDPIWFGVIMVIVLEVGLITPPVGLNVFVIKGAAPDVPLTTIFRGIWPFIVAAVFCIALIIVFPGIALYLPSKM
jgi:tripartite ATP-independent transporter DctM subunit